MSTPSRTPRQVFTAVLDGVTGQDWAGLPDLYAEDCVVEHPHAPGAGRIEGREAIREHFARAGDAPREMRVENLVVHETADPEVVIGEFDYVGRMPGTGRSFRARNIFVTRVRDGRIVESRDYADHVTISWAAGRPEELLAAADRAGGAAN
ncbi:nuclear transport factor 2 family protein [Plantactinospora siamensis]|uniref:Nuclear transport factor 2 family protein n=1 Tax=Plantactinospora siamensis TaxID=555372 RepID=A0ABV6NUT2_9ACTN